MRSPPLLLHAVSASFLCALILHTWRRAKLRLLTELSLDFGSSNISDGVGISTSGDRGSGVGVGGSGAAPATTGGATAEGAPVIPSWTTGELVRLSAPASGLCLTVVGEERRSRHRGAVAISLPGSPFARDWPPFEPGTHGSADELMPCSPRALAGLRVTSEETVDFGGR